jgi:hypothetical protein
MNDNHESWTRKAWQGLLLLVVIAIGARVVYGLLVPLGHHTSAGPFSRTPAATTPCVSWPMNWNAGG